MVIEEDGKTEEEYIEALSAMNDELAQLNKDAKELFNLFGLNSPPLAAYESVADARFGDQVLGPRRIILEFLPQMPMQMRR